MDVYDLPPLNKNAEKAIKVICQKKIPGKFWSNLAPCEALQM